MEKISNPVRILAILLVLLGVAGILAMSTMGGTVTEDVAATPVATRSAKQAGEAPAKAASPASPAKAAGSAPLNAPKPAAKPVVPDVPPTGFPLAVDKALRKHAVLVVSLVVPGARVDELSAAEARAGAKLGGAGYLALNVLNEGVARALLSKLDVMGDPSVLVLKRSGEVSVELAGFVDRETVAQAAVNAAS